jgi:hypothetical protein
MTREEFVKQRCEIDKITEEEFERTYRVVECNCGKIYCKGYRCLDLDDLLKENQELKKQLEERNIEYFKGAYDTHDKYYTQQKEFIKYLEEKEKQFDGADPRLAGACSGILQKYKEIIGEIK